MMAAQVIGNDLTITIAGQSGNFQLNVMLPVIAYNVLQSMELLSIGSRNLAENALRGLRSADAELSDEEALAMGRQVPRPVGKHPAIDDTVYGEVDGPETEDQYDANHVEPGEHV